MATGDKKKDSTAWMKGYTPSKKAFAKYIRGQESAYNPMIQTLRNQLKGVNEATDPIVQQYNAILAGMPTSESVSKAYGGASQRLADYIKGIDVTRAGKGVESAVAALGGALGVEGASDLATTAGTVSGVGAAGGDVFSKAIMGGGQAQLMSSEAQRLTDVENARREAMLGKGKAQSDVAAMRREMLTNLASAKGEKRKGRTNPFDIAKMLMGYRADLAALNKAYGGGGTGSGSATPTEPGDGVDPAEVKYRTEAIKASLGGVITPQSIQNQQAANAVSAGMQQGTLGTGYGPVIPGKYMAKPKGTNASKYQGYR